MNFSWKSTKEGAIDARKLAGGVLLVIRAEDVRRTNTGMHAKVTVALADNEGATQAVPVVADVLNIDKESYRHDFINVLYGVKGRRASKFSADFIEAYPRTDFERDLFDFSEEFFAQLVGTETGGWVNGDTDKSLPAFWVDGLVLKDGGTLLYAPPKSGKSYTGMVMAQSINAGVSSIFRVEQTVPLYINLERGARSMSRRLGLVNRVLGLPAEHQLLMLNKRGRTLADVYSIAKQMIIDYGVTVVFLDSLSRAGVGDMNANDKSNASMDLLNALCPSWVTLGHTPRADATHVYGSVMFDAAMDIGVNVRKERKPDGTLGIGLVVQEANDTGHPPMRVLAYEFDQYGLTDVRNSDTSEFPKLSDEEVLPKTNREIVYDQFLKFGRASVTQVAKDLQMNVGTVHGEVLALVTSGRLANLGREGRSIFYGVPAMKWEGE